MVRIGGWNSGTALVCLINCSLPQSASDKKNSIAHFEMKPLRGSHWQSFTASGHHYSGTELTSARATFNISAKKKIIWKTRMKLICA